MSYDGLEMENVLKGEIRAVRFLGNSKEYLIRIQNGETVASRQFAENEKSQFTVGDSVLVGFRESDAIVFEYPTQGLRKELEVA